MNLLCEKEWPVLDGLCNDGLLWFESINHFRKITKAYLVKDRHRILESALLGVLQAYKPDQFSAVMITINNKCVDISDLVELEPSITAQLQKIADSPKFSGEKEHELCSVTQRFIACIL